MIMFYNYEWVKINLFLYIVKPQNMKIFFIKKMPEKNVKLTRQSHAFISYANTYKSWCFEFYQSWTTDKNTESAIIIKLKDSLNEFRGFKFVTTMTLEFERIEKMIKQNKALFNSNSKAEKTINKSEIHLFESICGAIISNTQKYLGCR